MNPEAIEFTAAPGERLDKLIVTQVGNAYSRSQIEAWIKDGLVSVNGVPVKPGVKLKGGEHIHVSVPPHEASELVKAEVIPLTVVYDDADIAVIDKPAGMVVHPGVGGETGTLVNALLARYPEVAEMSIDEKRSGIVHRLDKDTSGLLVIAKNDLSRRELMEQFQQRTVEKSYLALLERTPKTRTGRIDAPIGRDPNQRKRMAVVRSGKPAVTEYAVLEDDFKDGQVYVKVNIFTGRTHQIRVHMAFIGCPVVGDTVYGFHKQRIKLKRLFLHAAHLGFDHPTSGDWLEFDSPLPTALQDVKAKLRG